MTPESKLCADPLCGTVFVRHPDQTEQSWKQTRYCDPCRGKRSKGKPVGTPNRQEPVFRQPQGLERDWRDRAACLGVEPELFFAVGTSGPAMLQNAEAKSVCARCPVQVACLSWALGAGADSGVWGGLDEEERRKLKRRQSRTRARAA